MSTVFQIYIVFTWIFVGLSLFSNLLSLQTFLSTKKIRETNCGIYLILLSIICIEINLVLPLRNLPISSESFQAVICITWDLVLIPSVSCLQWLNGLIASERALIECRANFSLYDPRRRSLVSSVLLIIIQVIWNSFPNIFCRQKGITINTCDGDLNRTGVILLSIFFYTNTIPFLLFILATIFILYHLAQHRASITDRKLTFIDFVHLCINHRDFFTPLVLYTISVIPVFIYYILHPYYTPVATRKTDVLGLIFELIYHFSTTLTFLAYVYANKVYREEFWVSSPVGCCLKKLNSYVCKWKNFFMPCKFTF
jgi:hypothetical protein